MPMGPLALLLISAASSRSGFLRHGRVGFEFVTSHSHLYPFSYVYQRLQTNSSSFDGLSWLHVGRVSAIVRMACMLVLTGLVVSSVGVS